MMKIHFLGAALGLLILSSPSARAEIPLTTTRVAVGVGSPVFVTAPPGDPNRLFIVNQGSGTTASIRILDLTTNTLLATPFLSLTGVDHTGTNERGLLGLAFHPDYATNGYFYIYVSNTASANSVRRYTVSANPDIADSASMLNILTMADPFPNHNGGWIGFGPDDYLYIATGDGGSANDPGGNAQNTASLLGKMLRLDVDGDDFPGDPLTNYAIPAGNPFAGVGDPGADEVWHYGLRNPWRDSFDRLTGELYIGDVGQNAFEEVDYAPAGSSGLNFGWKCMEANNCTNPGGCTCFGPTLKAPIHSYPLYVGGTLAVTGGYVYRGSDLCGMQGTYFFADYGANAIWTFRYTGGPVSVTTRTTQLAPGGGLSIASISSFGEDANGELYICDRVGGEIFKIIPGALVDCNANGIQDACDISGGGSADANLNGIPDECDAGFVGFCYPEVAGVRSCPCNNPQVPALSDRGCDNYIDATTVSGTGGAQLAVTGIPHASGASTLVFHTTGAHNPGSNSNLHVFWMGTTTLPAGVKSGFGVRCVGTVDRIYQGIGTGTGGLGSTNAVDFPNGTQTTNAWTASGMPTAGTTRYYYDSFRDQQGPTTCTTANDRFNVSHSGAVTWQP